MGKADKTGKNRQAIEKRPVKKKPKRHPKDAPRPSVAESDSRFKMFFDAAADAIVVFDTEGKIFYWNRAAETLFGYKAKEIVGSQLEVIIPESYRDDYRKALQSLKKGKTIRPIHQSFESEAVRKNGKEFPIAVSVSTAKINGLQYLIGIVRDISSLRAAQRSLGNSLAKSQLMYEGQRDGIFLVDLETQRFLEANRAAAEMYGYSKEEMLNMRIVDVFTEAEKGARFTPESATRFNIFKHKRKDGSVFPVEMTGCVLLWKDRKTFCAIVRDASDKVDSEKLSTLKEAVKSLNAVPGSTRVMTLAE